MDVVDGGAGAVNANAWSQKLGEVGYCLIFLVLIGKNQAHWPEGPTESNFLSDDS